MTPRLPGGLAPAPFEIWGFSWDTTSLLNLGKAQAPDLISIGCLPLYIFFPVPSSLP
jgi:hypothetical protein